MRKSLMLLFCALIALCAAGQGNFVKAYMINAKGDTIRGELKLNPKKEYDHFFKIVFKDAAGAQKTYKPAKIKGFGYDEKHFVALGKDDEAMFYERLTSGEILLYKSCFESVHMNETIREYAYYLSRSGDKKLTDVKETKFRKQLQEWMSGAAAFASEYNDEKKFNEQNAVAAISKYNEWKKNN